jgi:DnaK suppressor protein
MRPLSAASGFNGRDRGFVLVADAAFCAYMSGSSPDGPVLHTAGPVRPPSTPRYGIGHLMTGDTDIEAIRLELEARRDQMRERLATLAKRPERGSALGFGKRIGDGTTEAISRLTDIGVGGSLEHTLARTERALSKLDDGTYGICDNCAAAISPGRMRALPDSVLCLSCASRAPRRPPLTRR